MADDTPRLSRVHCRVEGCAKVAKKRSALCPMHRARIARHGTPDGLSAKRIAAPGSTVMRRLLAGIVSDDGCWIWGRAISSTGYGHLAVAGRMRGTHALMWEEYHGRPVPKGMVVCHTCDVRACINPEHLWVGDPAQNMADMVAKQRAARGSARSLLTDGDVREIREAKGTEPVAAVAQRFGVSVSTVYHIWARSTWAWLDADEESA